MSRPLLDPNGLARLREAFQRADYTADALGRMIGPGADTVLGSGRVGPALRASRGVDTPLATLFRLFVGAMVEPEAVAADALAPLPVRDGLEAGLLRRTDDGIRAVVSVRPYEHTGVRAWVCCDHNVNREGPLARDHVMPPAKASLTLADATVREPVRTALDLGTGSGVQLLHLAGHAGAVTGVDISTRALRCAATTAALNGQGWELVQGSFSEAVDGRRFDLVVSNPPFIVGPANPTGLAYRDSGLEGDSLTPEFIAMACDLLAEGGVMQFLTNWVHVSGQDWRVRVAEWLDGTGLDAWAVERGATTVDDYVTLWQTDARDWSQDRAEAWLEWFTARKVEGVGYGIVTLRRSGRQDPVVRVEPALSTIDGLYGSHVSAWLARQDWLATHTGDVSALLDARLVAAEGLHVLVDKPLEDDGWQVQRQLLARWAGVHRTDAVEHPALLDLIAGCRGTARLTDQLAVLAAEHGVEEREFTDTLVPMVVRLIGDGMIVPVDLPQTSG